MATPDLVAEHSALRTEQAELQKLCHDEWEFMSVQVARVRGNRLIAILDRLAAIERTKTWKHRA